ncbi:MAG: zinc ribbon domain-containing protein [Clostridiales bacterium]|nr:zinc ribbon domain-containing protein [Clostridiales bacterium]
MKYCPQCGVQAEDHVTFCPSCGYQFDGAQQWQAPRPSRPAQPVYDEQADVNQNRAYAILGYFGPLVLIPIFAAKDSPYARFHANQGLWVAIAYGAVVVLSIIISALLWRVWGLASLINWLLYVAVSVLAIIGVVNAAKGQKKELPVLGKLPKLLK